MKDSSVVDATTTTNSNSNNKVDNNNNNKKQQQHPQVVEGYSEEGEEETEGVEMRIQSSQSSPSSSPFLHAKKHDLSTSISSASNGEDIEAAGVAPGGGEATHRMSKTLLSKAVDDDDDDYHNDSNSTNNNNNSNSNSRNNKNNRYGSNSMASILMTIVWCIIDTLQSIRLWNGHPLLSGLDRVILGTAAASDVVSIAGYHPPQFLFYILSGGLCNIVQFLLDYLFHVILHIQDASLCWSISFTLSIAVRHTSHRYLVFGMYIGGYRNSLLRMYGGYSIIIVLSTIINFIMTRIIHIPHYYAWIFTHFWTAIVNYFILKKIWSLGS